MEFQNHHKDFPTEKKHNPTTPQPLNHTLSIYTGLTILIQMKRRLGLEAMLEYMDYCVQSMDQSDPRLKDAVAHVLTGSKIDKLYKVAMNGEEKN